MEVSVGYTISSFLRRYGYTAIDLLLLLCYHIECLRKNQELPGPVRAVFIGRRFCMNMHSTYSTAGPAVARKEDFGSSITVGGATRASPDGFTTNVLDDIQAGASAGATVMSYPGI